VSKKVSGVHLWLALWKTQKQIETISFGHINSLGICPSDFGVLEILLHKGDLPVNDIGKKMLLTSGSITSAIDRVAAKGFVKRKNHATDRRVKVVSLTKKGEKFIKNAFADHKKVMEKVFTDLDATQRSTLLCLLRQVGKSNI
jgi:MarR family 2-MHQ and catechol resistance regulon transcriptional repressor